MYKREDASREAVIKNLPKAKWVHMACHNTVNKKYNAGALMLAAPAMTSAIGAWITQLSWSQEQQGTSKRQLLSGTTFLSSTNLGSLVGSPMDEISSEHEMIRAVLSAQQLSNYKLQPCGVVLSTCSSSGGVLVGEEGILGLSRALLVAGAPALFLSLWNTQDAETSELMTQVYKRLITGRHLETGLPYNLAFAHREAVLSMIGKEDIQVRDWAVFQIYGTPDVIFPVGNQFLSWLRRSNCASNLIALGIAFCSILVAILYRLSPDVILGKLAKNDQLVHANL